MPYTPQENVNDPGEIYQRMERVEDTLTEVVDNVQSMRNDINRIGGYLSNIQGSDYHRKVEDSLPAIAGAQLNVRRCHVLKGTKLSGADELDQMIPGDDYADDIYEIDLVFSGREKGAARSNPLLRRRNLPHRGLSRPDQVPGKGPGPYPRHRKAIHPGSHRRQLARTPKSPGP